LAFAFVKRFRKDKVSLSGNNIFWADSCLFMIKLAFAGKACRNKPAEAGAPAEQTGQNLISKILHRTSDFEGTGVQPRPIRGDIVQNALLISKVFLFY
jgi:hypothetical protein